MIPGWISETLRPVNSYGDCCPVPVLQTTVRKRVALGEPISFSPKVQSPGVNAGALRASVPSSRSIPNNARHFRTILLLCTAVRRAGAGAPAHPFFSLGASRPATPVTSSRSLSKKEKRPGSPGKPLCRRCRATPGVASGSRGGPSGRPCRQARTAVPPHCLCRLFPCPVGFVQNPFVYRAKLNPAAFFEGDRRVHVFAAAHDSQGELARTKLRPTCAIMTRSGLTSAQFRKSHARKLPSLPTNPKGIGPFASGGANGNRGTAPRGEKVERRLASS